MNYKVAYKLIQVLIGFLVLLSGPSMAMAATTVSVSPASRTITIELTIPASGLTQSQINILTSGASVPLNQVLPANVRQSARITGSGFTAHWALTVDRGFGTPGLFSFKPTILFDSFESSTGIYSIDGTVITQDNIVLALDSSSSTLFPGTVTIDQTINLPSVVREALLMRLLQIRTGDPAVQFSADGSLRVSRSFLLQYSRTFSLHTTTVTYVSTSGPPAKKSSTTNVGPASINITTNNRSRGALKFAYLDHVSVNAGATRNLAPGVNALLSLQWQAFINGAGGGQLAVNASGLVIKTEAGKVLMTRPGFMLGLGLQRGLTIKTTTKSYLEMLNLPASITRQAQLLGSRSLVIERRISGGSRTLVASLRLPLLSTMSGPLRITREELFFEHNGNQGAYQLVVRKDDDLKATAVINFGGTGHLRGFWEIAGPLASRNEAAIFRPMPIDKLGQGGSLILRLLSGYPRIKEISGRLPSSQNGYYRLRFRIATPKPNFKSPQISYYVSNRPANQQNIVPELDTLRPIVLSWPADGAEMDRANPRMAWKAADFSGHYRVEIYAGDDIREPVIAGVASAKGQTTIALKPVTMARLEGGKLYYWRVVGINVDGFIVATSKLRSVRMQ